MATSWKSQQGNGEYSLQFETDNKEKYKLVERAAQMAVDGKTVADVMEVVRCKDCKHCEEDYPCKFKDEEAMAGYLCKAEGRYVPPEHFCSYGEKRD